MSLEEKTAEDGVQVRKKTVKKAIDVDGEDDDRAVQEQEITKKKKKVIVKKKIVKKKVAKKSAENQEDEGLEEEQKDEEREKTVKKKKVVKKVKSKPTAEESEVVEKAPETEEGADEPKQKLKKKVVKKKVVKKVKKTAEPKETKDEDGDQDEGEGENLGFASRKLAQFHFNDEDFEEQEAPQKSSSKKKINSDYDEDAKEEKADKPKKNLKKKSSARATKAEEDDIVEEDLDDFDGTLTLGEESRREIVTTKSSGVGHEDCDDEEAEESDATQKYIDEFSAVQNQDREMAARIISLRNLLYNPVPAGVTLKCQIDRHYDNAGSVYYSFILPVERRDGLRDKRMTLMIAKSRSGMHLKPTYVISLEPVDFRKKCKSRSERYFGKLQVASGLDAWGLAGPLQYVLYDDGYNPKKVGGSQPPIGYARRQLASVIYTNSKRATEDLRMSVALPREGREMESTDETKEASETKSEDEGVLMLSRSHYYSVTERICDSFEDVKDHPFLASAEASIVQVRTIPIGSKKRPAMSGECRFPVAPSVKNFELARHPANAHSSPDMGLVRIGKERFFVAVKFPFSPFEAFGVALSKFDASNMYRSKLGRKLSA